MTFLQKHIFLDEYGLSVVDKILDAFGYVITLILKGLCISIFSFTTEKGFYML